jgi:hypothetical protein
MNAISTTQVLKVKLGFTNAAKLLYDGLFEDIQS